MQNNTGTDARDIALHFLKLTDQRATPHIMKKMIQQAKSLLGHGYTKQEVCAVLDHIILVNKTEIYSLGYVSAAINDVLKEIERLKQAHLAQNAQREIEEQIAAKREQVKVDGESAARNREKAERNDVQSRFGKKYNFDMFEGK